MARNSSSSPYLYDNANDEEESELSEGERWLLPEDNPAYKALNKQRLEGIQDMRRQNIIDSNNPDCSMNSGYPNNLGPNQIGSGVFPESTNVTVSNNLNSKDTQFIRDLLNDTRNCSVRKNDLRRMSRKEKENGWQASYVVPSIFEKDQMNPVNNREKRSDGVFYRYSAEVINNMSRTLNDANTSRTLIDPNMNNANLNTTLNNSANIRKPMNGRNLIVKSDSLFCSNVQNYFQDSNVDYVALAREKRFFIDQDKNKNCNHMNCPHACIDTCVGNAHIPFVSSCLKNVTSCKCCSIGYSAAKLGSAWFKGTQKILLINEDGTHDFLTCNTIDPTTNKPIFDRNTFKCLKLNMDFDRVCDTNESFSYLGKRSVTRKRADKNKAVSQSEGEVSLDNSNICENESKRPRCFLELLDTADLPVLTRVDCWITVYGVLTDYMSLIMDYFQKFGKIVAFKSSIKANYLYIQYEKIESTLEALKTSTVRLSYGIIIGCIPAHEMFLPTEVNECEIEDFTLEKTVTSNFAEQEQVSCINPESNENEVELQDHEDAEIETLSEKSGILSGVRKFYQNKFKRLTNLF